MPGQLFNRDDLLRVARLALHHKLEGGAGEDDEFSIQAAVEAVAETSHGHYYTRGELLQVALRAAELARMHTGEDTIKIAAKAVTGLAAWR